MNLSGEPPAVQRDGGPRVVVVGAGIAGVGAVGLLRDGGIRDVILLEARDRPGGRVQTCVLEHGFVELGAQFLHGKNEVYNIAEREGMLVEQDPEEDSQPDTPLQFSEFLFQTSDGRPVNPHVAVHNLQVLEDLQLSANEALRQGLAKDVNVSVGQFFRSQHQAARLMMQGSGALKTAMFRWLEYWDCQDCGGTVDQLSLPGNGQYVFYPGNGTRETTSGMEAVFQVLLKESVPQESLLLNKAVKVVRWTLDAVQNRQPKDDRVQVSGLAKKGDLNNDGDGTEGEEAEPAMNGVEDDVQTLDEWTKQIAIKRRKSSDNLTNPADKDTDRTTNVGGVHKHPQPPTPNYDYDEDVGRTKPESGVSRKPRYAVKIECEDGDVFYADHVIVTSSVGFLSSNPQFFQPELPLQHQEAIRSMGFGNVAKMCLFWEKEDVGDWGGCPPFLGDGATGWERCILGSETEGMIPLWLEGVDTELKSARYCEKMTNGRQWYEEVCIYQVIQSHDFCIVAWLGGEAAIVMESLPESEVKDVLHELLALFLGRPDLPAPRRLIRTEWYSNPYTRGAYSFLATGVPLELHEVMSQPLPSAQSPVVQLAGEACSKRYYSTAHGALESGQDAARAILRHHKMAAPQ